MKHLIEILELVERGATVQEQLNNILRFILKHLKLDRGYISIVHKKKRLISESNPDGYSLKVVTSVGSKSDQDGYTVPIQYKDTYVGQICLIGAVDHSAVEEVKMIFSLVGMIIYFDKINEECKNLLEDKEVSKAKSMFMANVSHEIRTPLNAILGCLDYFAELELPRAGREVLEVMKHSSFNLLYLVNDILDISGLESNKMNLHLAPVKITDLITDAYKITQDAKPNKVSFQQFIEIDIPTNVITDAQRVKQIIINLLSNAFKFTEQGHVKLRVSLATAEDLETLDLVGIDHVSLTPNNSPKTAQYAYRKNAIDISRKGKKIYIKISVSDTGIGIKEKDVSKLFKSFSQIDSSTTKRYGGTGLGLAISAGFCKLLQGSVSLVSEWKKGSTFYFVIPVQEYLDSNEIPINLSILRDKVALIVDDKVDNIVRVTNILDKYGVHYQTTTSAKHAIASFINNKKYKFDFGLLDVYMPEMDGNQLAEYISKTERPCPLIALSSATTKLNDITGSFDVTLTKPYTEEQLLNSIHSILVNRKVEEAKATITPKQRRIRSVDLTNKSKIFDPAKTHKRSKSTKSDSGSGIESKNKSPPAVKNKPKSIPTPAIVDSSSSSSEFRANTNIEIQILVVEDNEYNQFTIKRMLNGLGYYNIDIASSGPEAIKLIQDNCGTASPRDGGVYIDSSKYDVILMDIIMPGMDGITTSRRIKRLFKPGKAPRIYAVTANVMPGVADTCFTKGRMDGFIEKPIDKTVLADYLSRLPQNSADKK